MKNRECHTKRTRFLLGTVLIFVLLCLPKKTLAQEAEIQWLSFEQLEDALAQKPKKVFIHFYTDWCAYCKKMDKAAFKNPQVVSKLNKEFYAVKMNAESTDSIQFGGDWFVNQQIGTSRNPTHQIPLLLASKENHPFSLPAMVFLNEKFEITDRHFEYLSPKQLLNLLEK